MHSGKIHRFQVKNFRNLKDNIYEFSEGINCIIGQNGNGKTNLLEAIYYLFTHKSFKKSITFPHLMSVDCDEAEIIFSSVINMEDEAYSYSGKVSSGSQEWFLNTKPQKRKYFATPIVINPFDAYNFYLQASLRRDFFDTHFSNINEIYSKTLKDFKKSLRMRNSLLSNHASQMQLRAIDENLSKYCFELNNIRLQLIDELNEYIPQTFKNIFSEKHNLKVELDSKWLNYTQGDMYNSLQQGLDLDFKIGHTKYCIHKDDYSLLFDGFKAIEFCSLGQQKMSFLSLLFAYIELFRYKFKTFPLVLLDDLSGELDETRWKNLVEFLDQQKFQVLITSANEKFRDELNNISNVRNFLIDSGSLIQDF